MHRTKAARHHPAMLPTTSTDNAQLAKPKPARPPTVQGKLAKALKAIVWQGLEIADAARHAEMTGAAVRMALEKPHVKAYLREQRQVFRAYVSSQNIQRAVKIRDESENAMAVMRAITYIDGDTGEQSAGSERRSPGIVIQIVGDETNITVSKPDESAPE